jgi:integrator complex subunit 7
MLLLNQAASIEVFGIGTATENAKLAFSEFCTNMKSYVVHDLILCTLKFTNAYYDMCCETSGSSCNLYHSLKDLTNVCNRTSLGIAAQINSSILQCMCVSHGILVKCVRLI